MSGSYRKQEKAVTFQDTAKQIVFKYVKERLDYTDIHVTFSPDEVYIVWFCKTLQNWKALLSTTLPDGMYYEVTYDGNRRRAYLDAYKKFDNISILVSAGQPLGLITPEETGTQEPGKSSFTETGC